MTIEEIRKKLEGVLSPKRFIHSVNVMNTSMDLAKRYGQDIEKAALAGILHDCARDIRGDEAIRLSHKLEIEVDSVSRVQPELLHGPIGSKLAGLEYGITDQSIKNAIYSHTTGGKNMSLLDKIIFIADYIEPNRTCPGVDEVRKSAYEDIDKTMLLCLERTIKYVLTKGKLIHPNTIDARNDILLEQMK